MNAEIVITGLGLVLPCGDGVKVAQKAWECQEPCFSDVPETLGTGKGGVCSGFSTAGIIPAMVNRRLDRATRFAPLRLGSGPRGIPRCGVGTQPVGGSPCHGHGHYGRRQ